MKLTVGASAIAGLSTTSFKFASANEPAELIAYSNVRSNQLRGGATIALSKVQNRYVVSVTSGRSTKRYAVRLTGDRAAIQATISGTAQIQVGNEVYKSESRRTGNSLNTVIEGTNNGNSGDISTQIFGGDDVLIAGILVGGLLIAGGILAGGYIISKGIDAISEDGGECTCEVSEEEEGDSFVADPRCDDQVPPLDC